MNTLPQKYQKIIRCFRKYAKISKEKPTRFNYSVAFKTISKSKKLNILSKKIKK